MKHLLRELAPIGKEAWKLIEDEARSRLTTMMAARKLVDFEGPHGWDRAAIALGRARRVDGPCQGVTGLQRQVLPLVELRADFSVSRQEIDDAQRGAIDIDLGGLQEAARRLALAENITVFHGYEAAGITGIASASSHPKVVLGTGADAYPTAVAKAVNILREAGIAGPFGLAIAPAGFTQIVETTEHGGYPLLEHLRHILEGPVVWAPGVDGAVVLTLRGGDFVLDVGQDVSIGYRSHTEDVVNLYLEETIAFRVIEPDAAVPMSI